MVLMFVYGTLKQGYGNNHRLMGASFQGSAISVDDNYLMQDVGFPCLWEVGSLPTGGSGRQSKNMPAPAQVSGEIYEVSPEQLASCDRLEGNGRMYTRQLRQFKIEGAGSEVTAWVYLWNLDRTHDWIEPKEGVLTWDASGRRKMRGREATFET